MFLLMFVRDFGSFAGSFILSIVFFAASCFASFFCLSCSIFFGVGCFASSGGDSGVWRFDILREYILDVAGCWRGFLKTGVRGGFAQICDYNVNLWIWDGCLQLPVALGGDTFVNIFLHIFMTFKHRGSPSDEYPIISILFSSASFLINLYLFITISQLPVLLLPKTASTNGGDFIKDCVIKM